MIAKNVNTHVNQSAAGSIKAPTILSRYEIINKPVGEGTYGVVYKCKEINGDGFVVRPCPFHVRRAL